MTSPYVHLIKMYHMLFLECQAAELKKRCVRDPSRVAVSWMSGEGVCVVCGGEGGLVGVHGELQMEDGSTQEPIAHMLYNTFYIEIIDEYKCAELCGDCFNRLKDAELFRRQVEAANEQAEEMAQLVTDQPSTSDHAAKKPKRSIFSSTEKKKTPLPPKLDKDATECPNCGERAVDYYHLRAHYLRHFLNLICEICGRGFYRQKSLDTHMLQHTEKTVKCNICGKDFGTKVSLNYHVKAVHNKVKMYLCKRCTLSFSSSTSRMKHMREVHNVPCRMYKCETCDQSFYTIQRRDLHVKRKHLQIKDHHCEWCDFSAVSAVELVNHTTKHSDVRNYTCEHCGKMFKTQRSVNEHIKTHQVLFEEPEPEQQQGIQYQLVQVNDNGDTIHLDNMETITFITM